MPIPNSPFFQDKSTIISEAHAFAESHLSSNGVLELLQRVQRDPKISAEDVYRVISLLVASAYTLGRQAELSLVRETFKNLTNVVAPNTSTPTQPSDQRV